MGRYGNLWFEQTGLVKTVFSPTEWHSLSRYLSTVFERINPKYLTLLSEMGTVNGWNTWGTSNPIDGTLKGSYDREQEIGLTPCKCMGKWASSCLGSSKVADKSNEITAIPALLELLDLADASLPLTQWVHKLQLTQIYNAKADYVLTQSKPSTLYGQVKGGLSKSLRIWRCQLQLWRESGKGHHRTEKRQVWCVPVSQLPPLYHQDDWVGLKCVVMVVRTKPMEQNYPWVQFLFDKFGKWCS